MNEEKAIELLEKLKANERSMDEIVGYIIRVSHQSNHRVSVGYNEVRTVLQGLREYFEGK